MEFLIEPAIKFSYCFTHHRLLFAKKLTKIYAKKGEVENKMSSE
jgi:hypothetical protein